LSGHGCRARDAGKRPGLTAGLDEEGGEGRWVSVKIEVLDENVVPTASVTKLA
jgi:hypothetical protein